MSKEINLYDLSKTEIDNVEEKLKEDPNLSFQKDSVSKKFFSCSVISIT